MKTIAYTLLATLFIFGKCKKDDAIAVTTDFQPLTVGSNWTYISNGVTSKITVTNKDTVALTRTYKVLSNDNGPNQYQAKVGNEYYRFATFQGFLPNGVEELYLKGDANVNASWQFSVPVSVGTFTIPFNAKYSVTEKGISKSVQGKTYTDVVHVRQDLSSQLGAHGGGDFYYAKGVGMISSVVAINVLGNTINNTIELVSYQIK